MKKFFLSFLFAIFMASNSYSQGITIFACEAEWQSLAKEIIQDKGRVALGTFGGEDPRDPHFRFGMKKVIKNADLIFCNGGHLEDSWLPKLVKRSYNKNHHIEENKYFFAYEYINSLEDANHNIDEKKMRSHNPLSKKAPIAPRIHLSPYNLKLVAKEFTKRVSRVDPLNTQFYKKSLEEFLIRLDQSILVWEDLARPLVGMRVVVTDDSWHEIADWLGLEIVAKINPVGKGFISQERNLNKIKRMLKGYSADAIIFTNYEDEEAISWLARKSFTRKIQLPITVNSADHSSDLFEMFSTIITSLLNDCANSGCHHANAQFAQM